MHRLRHKRQKRIALVHKVNFIDGQNHVLGLRINEFKHLFIRWLPTAAFNHKHHRIGFTQRASDRTVHPANERVTVLCLKTRRINEHKLSAFIGDNAQHTIAGCLRLFRGDAHLLADNRVNEGAFAHIGTTDDSDITAAEIFRIVSHLNAPLFSCARSAEQPIQKPLWRPPVQQNGGSYRCR